MIIFYSFEFYTGTRSLFPLFFYEEKNRTYFLLSISVTREREREVRVKIAFKKRSSQLHAHVRKGRFNSIALSTDSIDRNRTTHNDDSNRTFVNKSPNTHSSRRSQRQHDDGRSATSRRGSRFRESTFFLASQTARDRGNIRASRSAHVTIVVVVVVIISLRRLSSHSREIACHISPRAD